MPSLAERLWGKTKSLAMRVAENIVPDNVVSYSRADYLKSQQPKGNAQTDPLLDPKKRPMPQEPVKVDDGALVPQGGRKKEPMKALRKLDIPFLGTNYDPLDPDQTRPDPDGKGAAGVMMDDDMVASSLKRDGLTANLRLGTVIRVPSLGNKVLLVSDLMNERFNGENKIDFVRKNKKKEPDAEVNKNFEDIEILREGEGYEDVRKFVESGEWDAFKKENTSSYQEKLPTTLPPVTSDEWEPTQEDKNRMKIEKDRRNSVVINEYKPKLTDMFSSIVDKVKGKIPGMDTSMEKAVRDEIIKNYPLTDEAKNMIGDVDLNFVKEDSIVGGKAAAQYRTMRGNGTEETVTDKVFQKIWSNRVLDAAASKIPPKAYRLLMGEHIDLDSISASTAFHEGLHAIFERKRPVQKAFLKDWESARLQSSTADNYNDVQDLMNWVEETTSGGLYERNSDIQNVTEMFAYLGEYAGRHGLNGIPGPLRKYYEGILLPQDMGERATDRKKGKDTLKSLAENNLSKPSR